ANSKVASERLNQGGDLMFMLNPQTSVWGFNANSKVASERRFMVKFKFILLFIILLQSTTPIQARKIKTRHSIPKQTEKSIKDTPIESPDSIISLSIDSLTFTDKILPSIRFYGFDKTVTSSMESFFISNALDSAITGMEIEITYFDMQGRQLHNRTVPLSGNVRDHETIRTDIKSWDTQKSFYYHKSAKPKRQATPFNVKLRLLSLIQKREAIQPPQ
ncbi:MAG: hypothetical protein K2I08_09315, partial [Muribaculaceae bacterium]|nr:hypothetical protein [Muribaculaceae bacterium]